VTLALTPGERRMSLIAILSTCAAFAIGLGLTLPLLSLTLERRGFAGTVNGLNLATAGLAAICATPFVPWMIHRFGTARFLSACLILSAIALIVLYEVPSLWLWFPARFVLSCGLNSLFVVSEFWINQLADESNRGRYISLYGACVAGGFGIGPAILAIMGTRGIMPFVCGAAMLLAALIPIFIARHAAPQLEERGKASVLQTIRIAPAALIAALVFGAIDAGLWGLFPVYAVRSGYSETGAALAITATSLGSFLFQWPLGRLADRMDRRTLLTICAASGIFGAVLTPLLAPYPALLYALLFLWGGMVMGIYTTGLTLLGERFKGAELANANAAYVMLYATGLLAGPTFEGAALDAWNPHGLMLVLGLITLIYLGFLLTRRRESAPMTA
jgi:MFS family permease